MLADDVDDELTALVVGQHSKLFWAYFFWFFVRTPVSISSCSLWKKISGRESLIDCTTDVHVSGP
jgi:hypothetical protein